MTRADAELLRKLSQVRLKAALHEVLDTTRHLTAEDVVRLCVMRVIPQGIGNYVLAIREGEMPEMLRFRVEG